mmetsp:Transcript_5702/g.8268  ORF Transcript_5702/g.8268 Transcript_5702/m.8268 type:complete len:520 (-) Transcript_5702:58-1617(-)
MNWLKRRARSVALPLSGAMNFRFGRYRFRFIMYAFIDIFMYLLGPTLICLALSITAGVTYTYFRIIFPMIHYHQKSLRDASIDILVKALLHTSFVTFVLINVLFNYMMCVTTKNSHTSPHYKQVVRELATATGFEYPESIEDKTRWKNEFRQRIYARGQERNHNLLKMQQSQLQKDQRWRTDKNSCTVEDYDKFGNILDNGKVDANTIANTIPTIPRPWMLCGALEWGWCERSKLPKPPRSHYDHVTQSLVLNLDHYCPWMFNSIGYFNYRYFCNFLLFVSIGMVYGAIITFQPFILTDGHKYYKQIHLSQHQNSYVEITNTTNSTKYSSHDHSDINLNDVQHIYHNVPIPSERAPIALTFMLCLSVGFSVSCLFAFHLYLILTSQTTIEFYGNCAKRRRARRMGRTYRNAYDLGCKRNFQQIWGSSKPFLKIFVPIRDMPDFLPVPMKGDVGKRKRLRADAYELRRIFSSSFNNAEPHDASHSLLPVYDKNSQILNENKLSAYNTSTKVNYADFAQIV